MRKAQRGIEQRSRLYAYLCEVAARGDPMPTNAELREAADAGNGKLSEKLAWLQGDGLISVEHKPSVRNGGRRCIILANGDSTAWQAPPRPYERKAHASDRPIVNKYPLLASRGLSDFAIYGHLAEAVRACRRAGDVVHRNPDAPLEILINGRPRDVKERAAWHAGQVRVPHRACESMCRDLPR